MSGDIRSALFLLILLAGVTACDRDRQVTAATKAAGSELEPALEPAPAVPGDRAEELPVVTVSDSEPIDHRLSLDSHLLVERNIGVTARRDGIVEEIHRDRGEQVAEGDPLATLEREDLLLAEQIAILELEKEESSFGRARRLFEQQIISSEEFETARLRRDAAEKSLERIRYELSKSVIRAPFGGVVSGRYVEKGQVIRKDDRTTLFQVTALRPLLARIYIPEWALFGLTEDRHVRVIPTGGPSASPGGLAGIQAKVKWLSPVVDPASGSVEALVEVLDVPGAGGFELRPGMSVQVDLDLTFGGISIPLRALSEERPSPGKAYNLRVLDSSGIAQYRTIRTGIVGDSRIEVRDGLEAGEKVVLAR